MVTGHPSRAAVQPSLRLSTLVLLATNNEHICMCVNGVWYMEVAIAVYSVCTRNDVTCACLCCCIVVLVRVARASAEKA